MCRRKLIGLKIKIDWTKKERQTDCQELCQSIILTKLYVTLHHAYQPADCKALIIILTSELDFAHSYTFSSHLILSNSSRPCCI